ncbi:uncharacterized protein LOC123308484 [Coccinella septempunctata]|uniref:uncharacterized protein LOC123308484 n=1 Tax=Coccinella septempunctata TaxID=41139 RepID=UPI001D076691|nr:uncharacterized protein LOC123308484 [Coccinella septempunctata]
MGHEASVQLGGAPHVEEEEEDVDDILCLWNGSLDVLQKFLEHLNSIHRKIKFTMEVQKEGNIKYLDLSITNDNGNHSFQVYRKPSHTGVVIHNTSFHPFSHRLSSIRSYVYRALALPLSSVALGEEIDVIKQIARNNGFSEGSVDRMICRRNRQALERSMYINQLQQSDDEPKQYVSLTFNGTSSHRIAKILRERINVMVSFRTVGTVSELLMSNKDRNSPLNNAGVYKLNCTCGSFYIGRTKRSFDVRFKEHHRCIRQNNTESLFSEHILETGHPVDLEEGYNILHRERRVGVLNNLEYLEIIKHCRSCPDKILNAQLSIEHRICALLKWMWRPTEGASSLTVV